MRAYRKRERILKFEGGFHGMNDYALMSMSPKRRANSPEPAPDSAGIPQVVRGEVLSYKERDFIALAKNPNSRMTFGSGGIGNNLHLAGELFKKMAAVDLVFVPYKYQMDQVEIIAKQIVPQLKAFRP